MAKTNPRLVKLIEDLKTKSREEGVAIWRDVAERLERPTRNYPRVNLSQINRSTKDGETALIPGKVLGDGVLDHLVTVVGLGFSRSAVGKIKDARENCMTIEEILNKNPKGSGVRMIQ
jgi:large subunit ribosomal protein L18e